MSETTKNLRRAGEINSLADIDRLEVTKRMMEELRIRNRDDLDSLIDSFVISLIREYLKLMDVIAEYPVVKLIADNSVTETHTLITQPGMRYAHAQSLVKSLLEDRAFKAASMAEQRLVTERILDTVRGRMLEEIVLFETMSVAGSGRSVMKVKFLDGEFDMMVYDRASNRCAICEIKYSKVRVPQQRRHLLDERNCSMTERIYGCIAGRYVLYRGEDTVEDGVIYMNVETYLKGLPGSIDRLFR